MAAENARHYTHPLLRGHDLPAGTQIGLHASLGRLAGPEEIAAAITFLVSPTRPTSTAPRSAADGGWM